LNDENLVRIVHVNKARENLQSDNIDAILQLTITPDGSDVVFYGEEFPLAIQLAVIALEDEANPTLSHILAIVGETIRMVRQEDKTMEECLKYWRENPTGFEA
jgi:hypothetical protein